MADQETHSGVGRAVATLASGGLVALPTETVYGLAANALDGEAVARIFEAKGRPSFNPLIVHVPGETQARDYAEVSELAEKLIAAFWPGPLTIVLPRTEGCALSELVSAGLGTVALRSPAHPLARDVLTASALPLAAPSANVSGRISPTHAEHVVEGLADMVLDGGPCEVGLESTIVGVSQNEGTDTLTLLRPGRITVAELEAATGAKVAEHTGGIAAPGQMSSHYAPDHPLRLNATQARDGEVLIGFGDMDCDLNLSEAGDLIEAAANLFAMLHEADARATSGIAVTPVPLEGLGVAINDRLTRAAAPRGEE